jgi:uncharacterized 2Fe-2S/4Fe-4S cluster protein (DUF4445 family)
VPTVTFLPAGDKPAARVDVPAGTDLLEAAALAGVRMTTGCGGTGMCGDCLVVVQAGAVDRLSGGSLPEDAAERGLYLACRTGVRDEDVTVELSPSPASDAHAAGRGQFAESAPSLADSAACADDTAGLDDPPVFRRTVEVPPARPEDGLSDLDRLLIRLGPVFPDRAPDLPLPLLRTLAEAVRSHGPDRPGIVTLTLADDGPPRPLRIVDLQPGVPSGPLLGLAVDIGTTSVAVQLVDLGSRTVLETRADYNGQVARGLDVIGRINYAARPGGLDELSELAVGTINGLVRQVCLARSVEPSAIGSVSVAGNTTMVHLLLGLPPERIRVEPYTPTVRDLPPLSARELGMAVNPLARVHLAPAVGSYVGGDIVAGLSCTDLDVHDEVGLFLDIGTNGELVVGNRDFLMTCACSAGPAFEGGSIGCGMPASLGAVDWANVDPDTGACTFSTIGSLPAAGICGSGMISLLASLLRTGWIDPAGRLDRSRPCPSIVAEGRRARYVLAPAGPDGTREIAVSETDIENILRAKAAIFCACELLLDRAGLGFGDLRTFTIAGGFGRFLSIEDGVTIGLLPDIERSRFRYVGNSSLAGARLALLSSGRRDRLRELAGKMTYIELMTSPDYLDGFTAALFLPHTDLSRFPSVVKRLRRPS